MEKWRLYRNDLLEIAPGMRLYSYKEDVVVIHETLGVQREGISCSMHFMDQETRDLLWMAEDTLVVGDGWDTRNIFFCA